MKILFMSFNDPHNNPGGYRKETEYCREMKKMCARKGNAFMGVNVFSEPARGKAPDLPQTDAALEVCRVTSPMLAVFSRFRLLRAVFRTGVILKAANGWVRRFQPQVILFRYNFMYIVKPFNPKKIDKQIIFLSIHHSKEPAELGMNPLAFLFVPFERILARSFFRHVDGVIGVTEEITRFESERIGRDIPTHVFPNGINVKDHPARTESIFTGDELRMIFVAGVYDRWHGLDRLLKGMSAYRGPVNLVLTVVGAWSGEVERLAEGFSQGVRIQFIAHPNPHELRSLLDQAHLAIGGLGLHRKKLNQGCTLKVRDYLAWGIPFVISHEDVDLDETLSLYLRVPADESPVDVRILIDFVKDRYSEFGGRMVPVMREYAAARIGYGRKIDELLSFIATIKNP